MSRTYKVLAVTLISFAAYYVLNKLFFYKLMGLINPILTPKTNSKGEITDIEVTYPSSFPEEMLQYSKNYGFLPLEN